MQTSLAAQLAALELGHLSIARDAVEPGWEIPSDEAMSDTLTAAWSDLFGLFAGTALEADAEELAWGFVNLFHRAAAKRSAAIDRATDEIRLLIADADGSEVQTGELEKQVERAQAADAAMIALETMRDAAALHYLNETGSSWRPAGGSRLNHGPHVTSAVVQGRAYLAARAESKRNAAMPMGTPIIFAGGRHAFPTETEAKIFADNVWSTLDKVRDRVADMLLIHGGDGKGVDRLASAWAERHRVPQIAFGLDTRLGSRAGFRRNEQMLALKPRYVVAFSGNGVLERLVIDAKRQRTTVVDRRGPLGTCPKSVLATA